MPLSTDFVSRFSKKGIFLRDFENFVTQQSQLVQNGTFLVDYDIPENFAKMFTRQELTQMMNNIFTDLQFVNISVQNAISPTEPNSQTNSIEKLKQFQYCFYKVETTADFKKADVICIESDNWIGIKAKFVI